MSEAPRASHRLPATLVDGRYRLEAELGRGAMGAVYRALDEVAQRPVALKLLLGQPDPRRLERFRREGEATARLDHPGIVRVHATGELQGRPYLVYELVPGARTFAEALPAADVSQRAAWVRDAARALGAAHALGLVHRDVKPENLLVDADGRVRVTDFGVARLAGAERLTQTGALLGTPHYMSPEQMLGEPAGPPSDVWALGVVLYEALVGERPFPAEDLLTLRNQVVDARPTPPSQVAARCPRALEDVCLRALAKDAAERYPDASALAAALDAALSDGDARPRSGLALALAVVGATLGVAFAGALLTRPDARPAPSASPRAPAASPGAGATPAVEATPAVTSLGRVYATFPAQADLGDETYGLWIGPQQLVTWNVPSAHLALWEVDPRGRIASLGRRDLAPNDVAIDASREWLIVLEESRVRWFRVADLVAGRPPAAEHAFTHQPGVGWRVVLALDGSPPRIYLGGGSDASGEPEALGLLITPRAGTQRGDESLPWRMDGASVYQAIRAPDGGVLVAWGANHTPSPVERGELAHYDLRRPGSDALWRSHDPGGIAAIAFAPDGDTCVILRKTGRLDLWSWSAGWDARRPLEGSGIDLDHGGASVLAGVVAHRGGGTALAFLPDGLLVTSAGSREFSAGRELRAWRLPGGQEVWTQLEGVNPASLACSPDGRWLFVGMGRRPSELRGTGLPE